MGSVLYGRDTELAAIEELLDRARTGGSGALVVRGDAGIGKTALLGHAAATEGFQVIRGTGIEAESELPFAGLHMLLRSGLDRLDTLPAVQAEALRGALGLAAADPDRFLVGLAVLSLLAELAAARPLLCVVDDAHWLDRASADALLFAARRLDSEGVALLFGARPHGFPAAGLPELQLSGLSATAATELLAGHDLTAELRYRILAEAAGNPLALLELPRAVGTRHSGPLPLTDRLRESFESRLTGLPEATRTLLLVGAADGDLPVILRAAAAFGATLADLEPAQAAGLVEVTGDELVFRHPLIRAAVQHAAPLALRRAAHRALAGVLDGPDQAARRACQLAQAADGPDEQVAAALEATADPSAVSWFERAAQLSIDPAARTRRLVLAAEAAAESGDLDRAADLATQALPVRPGAEDLLVAGRVRQVLATVEFVRGDAAAAYRRQVEAAELVTEVDPGRAAELLIEAAHLGWYTGRPALADSVARLEALALPEGQGQTARLLIRAVAPILGRPVEDLADPAIVLAEARAAAGGSASDLVLIAGIGLILGHDGATQEVGTELAGELRRSGRIGWLPSVLFYAGCAQAYAGRHEEARQTLAEAVGLARDTGQSRWSDQLGEPLAHLAAVRGDEAECRRLADAAMAGAGQVSWNVPWVHWALGLLDLGLGRAESALARLEQLTPGRRHFHISATRSTPDLVEAAVRVGKPDAAAEPLALFEEWSRSSARPWTSAVVHRCRALLAGPGPEAERHFQAALPGYEEETRPFEEARTRLLYGEWLRREKRKADARTQLTAALETFERLAATPWAERARGELTATGTTMSPAGPGPTGGLTPQELQIVRLAAQGLSNKDIAAQLFLSPRTVGHHLYKAYPKLGVASRGELSGLALDG